jgi:hypothetical protein
MLRHCRNRRRRRSAEDRSDKLLQGGHEANRKYR